LALAATRFIENEMAQQGITADFDPGGITARIVKLHEPGLVKKVLVIQSFDGKAYAVVRKTDALELGDKVVAVVTDPKGCAMDAIYNVRV
jgi:citrate lyase subunit alpha/citrate CoA-transferase